MTLEDDRKLALARPARCQNANAARPGGRAVPRKEKDCRHGSGVGCWNGKIGRSHGRLAGHATSAGVGPARV